MIAVELSRIVIRERSHKQYIYLSEKEGDRFFLIIIGIFEAIEINRKVSGSAPSFRPMTHDLIRNVLEALDTKLVKIVINDLQEGTFYANLYLERDGEEKCVDSRPSDAIALATGFGAPIFVEDRVMDEVGKTADQEGEEPI